MTDRTRRDDGAGSFHFSESKGAWIGAIWLGRRRVYRQAPTKKECQAKIAEAKKKYTQGQGLDVVTMRQYLEYWLENVVKPNRSANTYTLYEAACRLHIEPLLGAVALDQLTVSDVQRWINQIPSHQKTRTLTAGGVRDYLRVLRTALNRAVRERRILYNPATLADAPAKPKERYVPWDRAEAAAFSRAIVGHPHEVLYRTAIFTGMRRGELCALKWADVDFDGSVIHVPGTKTRNSDRYLPMLPNLEAALRRHKAAQAERRLQTADWQNNDLVFPKPDGRPEVLGSVSVRFPAHLAQFGIRRIPFHGLRKCCGTLLHAEGVPLLIISRILGHANLATTGDIYTRVLGPEMAEAMGKLDALFG